MSHRWTAVKLGDVAHFIRGVTFKPDDVLPPGVEGSVNCMRTKNVQRNLDTSDVWAIKPDLVNRTEQYLQLGDTLVSSANSWNLVGKCCWVPDLATPSTFGGFVSVLRTTSAQLDPRYLYHWFSSPSIQSIARSFSRQTTNIANLNLNRCLELDIPLPPIAEQHRIAEVLDRADSLRNRRSEATATTSLLSQAIFVEMFGDPLKETRRWESVQFRQLTNEFRYGTSNKASEEGFPALRIPNVVGGTLNLKDLKCVPVKATELDKLRLREGDLLFVRSNGNPDYVGRCGLFSEEVAASTGYSPDTFIYASYLIRARLDANRVDPVYAREFMLSPAGRSALRGSSKTSAGQYNINIEGLSNVTLPVPPLALQQDFAKRVAATTTLRQRSMNHASELDALFEALRDRAFRGEL